MLATLKNNVPLTEPMSMARVCPSPMTRSASSRSSGMVSVRARSLAVPVGRMPSGRLACITPDAAALSVPSPPGDHDHVDMLAMLGNERRNFIPAAALAAQGLDAVASQALDRRMVCGLALAASR